jgi:hypothetical protein
MPAFAGMTGWGAGIGAKSVDAEGGAAAAGGGGVGVLDGEMGAHQRVLIIEFGAGQEVEAGGVDEDGGTFRGDDKIVIVLGGGEVEFILEAGAAAGQNFDAQGLGGRVGSQDFGGRRMG